MSEFPTPIAPLAPQPTADASGEGPESSQQEPPTPPPITEQEVGEYREQDRYLPVCHPTGSLSSTPLTYKFYLHLHPPPSASLTLTTLHCFPGAYACAGDDR